MNLFEAIHKRRSIRRFSSRPVEDDKLQAILEAIRQSPSWANQQCWNFIIIRDDRVKTKISEYTFVESYFTPRGFRGNPAQKGVAEAPVLLIACADPEKSGDLWNQKYYLTDMGIAAQNLMLSARALELGTVFVGVFDEKKIKKHLEIPSSIRVVGLFPLGYPLKDKPTGPGRKPLAQIMHTEKWQPLPDNS
jgi:nitroreductase